MRLHVESARLCRDVAAAIHAARSASTQRRDRRARAQGERVLATLPASGDLYLDRFGRAHHFTRSEDATLAEAEVTLSPDGPPGDIYARIRYPAAYASVRGLHATPTTSVAFFDDPLASGGVRGVTYGPTAP